MLALVASLLLASIAWAHGPFGEFTGPIQFEVEFRRLAMDPDTFDQFQFKKKRVWSYGWKQETGELVFSNNGTRPITHEAGEALQKALREQGVPARYVSHDNPGTRRLFRAAELFGLPHRACAEPALVGGENLKLGEIRSMSKVRPKHSNFAVEEVVGGFLWEPCHSHCRQYLDNNIGFLNTHAMQSGFDLADPAVARQLSRSMPRSWRLRFFARRMGSRAWIAMRAAPGALLRLGVSVGVGLGVGLGVDYAVTRWTGNSHAGFAAGYVAGAGADIAVAAALGSRMAIGASAAAHGALRASVWALPVAILMHAGMVTNDYLAEPVAMGDPQAIELQLYFLGRNDGILNDLAAVFSIYRLWYGIEHYWNNPGDILSIPVTFWDLVTNP
jgi:hypothetical protein